MTKRAILLSAIMGLLCACQEAPPVADAPATDTTDRVDTKPQNYVALPGQAATSATMSDTARAFEYAAASYAQQPTQQQEQQAPAAAPQPAPSAPATPPSGSDVPYAVQITNGTTGRLFIEAQDEGSNIFPIGFMHAGQRISSQPQEARAIQGHLIIVVRDPDRAGAPELRRYRVEPPPHYQGKTLGITVLPGGRYRLMLDGEVYYSSPEPAAGATAS